MKKRASTLIIGGALLFAGCGDDGSRPAAGDGCETRGAVACTSAGDFVYCGASSPDGPNTWRDLDNNPTGACACSADGAIVCPSVGDACEVPAGNSRFTCAQDDASLECVDGQWSEWEETGAVSGCDCEDKSLSCWDAGFIGIRRAGDRDARRARRTARPETTAPITVSH